MVALKPLLLLLALGVEALAGPAKPASCTTILGTKTVKNVPTSITTAINKITIIKKVVRKVNVVVVPVAKTTTIRTTHVATVTSVDHKTDTAWVTLTSPSTSWFTITVTVYDPSTTVLTAVTTKDITVTVPRPAGFTPIGDSDELVPSTLKKRDARIQTTLPGGTRPQSVRCVVDKPQYSTKTVSTTVQGPRRTLKAATKTKMSTISTTTTETQYPPNVKTTMTTITRPVDTSFTFVSSTIMMYTETVTVESQVPKATVYDMCQEDNILSTANNGGYFVGHLGFSGLANSQAQVINSARSPKDCCQACAANPGCMTSWFFGNDLICNLFMAQDPKTCANNAQPLVARYLTDTQNIHWIFSNGPCGHWENAGSTN